MVARRAWLDGWRFPADVKTSIHNLTFHRRIDLRRDRRYGLSGVLMESYVQRRAVRRFVHGRTLRHSQFAPGMTIHVSFMPVSLIVSAE